jgi:hypothetical protein
MREPHTRCLVIELETQHALFALDDLIETSAPGRERNAHHGKLAARDGQQSITHVAHCGSRRQHPEPSHLDLETNLVLEDSAPMRKRLAL